MRRPGWLWSDAVVLGSEPRQGRDLELLKVTEGYVTVGESLPEFVVAGFDQRLHRTPHGN